MPLFKPAGGNLHIIPANLDKRIEGPVRRCRFAFSNAIAIAMKKFIQSVVEK